MSMIKVIITGGAGISRMRCPNVGLEGNYEVLVIDTYRRGPEQAPPGADPFPSCART